MDYGVTKNPATVATELAPYVPGIAPGDATAAAVKGRNNWIVWAGGNDRLWNDLSVESAGIIRDRERGVPRFNEFRRQYGLRQLRSYDDFIDTRQPSGSPERTEQERLIATLRAVYGQHRCDASKVITAAQLDDRGNPITDCLGFADGTLVDNIEDVDTVIGWLAEFRHPHGIAISETQLQVFILNASRRLLSDRFFTSSFRPEFYSSFGVRWVTENGPDGKRTERGSPNGHAMEVSPLKRVLLRNVPELRQALEPVINAFDPWARDRGTYYSLQWTPRSEARSDPPSTSDRRERSAASPDKAVHPSARSRRCCFASRRPRARSPS